MMLCQSPHYKGMETWKAIPDYEGLYEVSDMGRVRSVDRVVESSKRGAQKLKGQIITSFLTPEGYFKVNLCKDGISKNFKVHKLVKNSFHGPTPKGLDVLHGKDGKKCNKLSNLEFGTKQQNNGPDKVRDGTDNRGENHPHAKLTETDVRSIKKLLNTGWIQKDIAKIFGVTDTCISRIKCGKGWAHLDR
jgi:hypothetical protein